MSRAAIVIGGSAGALSVLETILSALPTDFAPPIAMNPCSSATEPS